jgi:hypothetical protein
MSWVAVAVVGGAVASGYLQSQGAQNAANTQANAALQQQGNLLAAGQQASQNYAPYITPGTTALNTLSTNPYFTNQFTSNDLNSYLAPGYGFRLGQGQTATNQAVNASGGAMSGNASKALQDYTQNFASGEYANAFNQYQTQRQNIYSNLQNIANMGLTATQGQTNAQLGTATNIANIGIANANAQAANQVAQGNIYGSVANTAGNMAGYSFLNNMNNPTPFNADQVALGGSGGGGSFTPTPGNSFTLPVA